MSVSEDVKKEEKGGAVSSDPEKEKALTNSSITNSEDQKLIKARIFVGNLPADLRTEKGEIYDKFRKYGRIIGVSIHSRFAFVQFENENDAKTAVKGENHSELRSARLELKMAIEGRVTNRNRDERDRRRSRSPIDRRRRDGSRDRDIRRDSRDHRGTSRDRYRNHSRTASPPPYIPSPVEERFCHPRTYGANDVELVVIRKQQGQYADSILRRLYQCQISANMLFLAEHAELSGAVNEFGRCGTHYVIIIMPKHEDTRAMTINMFEGTEKPREYRNLNVDEGVALISRHFNEHYPALARLRQAEIQGPSFYPPAPVEVARTLARVVELSAVPTSSLDSTIRYLQEMRERTAAFEGLAPQPVVAGGPYAASLDTSSIGKPYSGIDERARMLASTDSDNIRDSLLGLLKVTGLSAGVPSGQLQAAQMAAAYSASGGAGDYRGGPYASYPGTNGSSYTTAAAQSQGLANAASLAGLAADPAALQKALASLGVLGQQQTVTAPSGVVQSQQNQAQQVQREPQGSIAAYRTSSGAHSQSHAEENGTDRYQSQGGGGGGHQVTMDRSGGGGQYGQASHVASQQQQYQNGLSQQQQSGHGQQQLSATQLGGRTLQAGMGSSNGLQSVNVPQGSLYVTSGAGGGGGAGAYIQQSQQQPQQIQRSMQQQQSQQSAYGSGGSRR